MNRPFWIDEKGFSLVETILVLAIIAALVSIAVPHYTKRRQEAQAVACLSNRHNIEMDEAAYFSQHQSASLQIDEKYRCPEGGTYVWLVSDPDTPGYPRVGCSLHYAGLDEAVAPEVVAPETEQAQASAKTPTQGLAELLDYIRSLDLPASLENSLVDWVEKAEQAMEKGHTDQAAGFLDSLQRKVDQSSNAIDADTAASLKEKAAAVQELLSGFP